MITLVIQLVFQSKPKLTHQEVTNYLIEHFPLMSGKDPKEGMIISVDVPTEEGELRFKLNQKALTVDQRDFLHLDEVAEQYIDSYNVLLPDKPSTPTASDWQEMKHEMEDLRQRVRVLERNNPNVIQQRFLDFFNGMDVPQAPQQPTIDADNLREHVYSAQSQVQRAIDALEPIHHDSVLRQVMIDLTTAMDAILEIREMIPEE